MFSTDELEEIIKKVMALIGYERKEKSSQSHCKKNTDSHGNPNDGAANSCFKIEPADILVISALVTGALNVDSILVSKDQIVQIVLSGSLKRPTELDKVMEEVGKAPFEQVIKSLLGM